MEISPQGNVIIRPRCVRQVSRFPGTKKTRKDKRKSEGWKKSVQRMRAGDDRQKLRQVRTRVWDEETFLIYIQASQPSTSSRELRTEDLSAGQGCTGTTKKFETSGIER